MQLGNSTNTWFGIRCNNRYNNNKNTHTKNLYAKNAQYFFFFLNTGMGLLIQHNGTIWHYFPCSPIWRSTVCFHIHRQSHYTESSSALRTVYYILPCVLFESDWLSCFQFIQADSYLAVSLSTHRFTIATIALPGLIRVLVWIHTDTHAYTRTLEYGEYWRSVWLMEPIHWHWLYHWKKSRLVRERGESGHRYTSHPYERTLAPLGYTHTLSYTRTCRHIISVDKCLAVSVYRYPSTDRLRNDFHNDLNFPPGFSSDFKKIRGKTPSAYLIKSQLKIIQVPVEEKKNPKMASVNKWTTA